MKHAELRAKDKEMVASLLLNDSTQKLQLTYLIFVATVISVNDRWSSVPQSFIDSVAKASLLDSGQVLQDI